MCQNFGSGQNSTLMLCVFICKYQFGPRQASLLMLVLTPSAKLPVAYGYGHIYSHCNTLQHTATHCNTSADALCQLAVAYVYEHMYSHCNTLQHAATHCNTSAHVLCQLAVACVYEHIYSHCNTLQHTATRCNALQQTATHVLTSSSNILTLDLSLYIYVCTYTYMQCQYTFTYLYYPYFTSFTSHHFVLLHFTSYCRPVGWRKYSRPLPTFSDSTSLPPDTCRCVAVCCSVLQPVLQYPLPSTWSKMM